MKARGRAAAAAGVLLQRLRGVALLVLLVLLVTGLAVWSAGCDSAAGQTTADASTATDPGWRPTSSGDIEGVVGEALGVGKAVITVRALDATFNPVTPERRMSEQIPSAPGGDESFYQAFVTIANRGVTPIRVDPEDFACAVGNSVVGVEGTWSGPAARSLLKNSSLEFLVTFKAKAGHEPALLYSPSWYDGTIRVRKASSPTS